MKLIALFSFFFLLFLDFSFAKCFNNISSSSSNNNNWNHKLTLSSDLTLRWYTNVSSPIVSFQLENRAIGFVAIGFSKTSYMIGTDSIIIEPDIARFRCPIHQVLLNGKSKALFKSVNKSDSSLIDAMKRFEFLQPRGFIAEFSRSIEVSNKTSGHGQVSLLDASFLLIAWSTTSNRLSKHTDYRIFTTTIFEETTSEYFNIQYYMRIAHAVLMTLAWAVIVPIGIAVARYGKFSSFRGHPRDELSTSNWLLWHRRIQWIAWFLFVFGFITIIASKDLESQHFYNSHGILGLPIILFGIMQPLTGWCRGRIHRLPGYVAVIAAMSNVFLGFITIGVQSRLFSSVYEAYVSIVITIYVLLEMRLHMNKQLQTHGARANIGGTD